MSIFAKVKEDQLEARKSGLATTSSLLTTLLGEASTMAKNFGTETLADREMIALIKKFKKNNDEVIDILNKKGNDTHTQRFENAVLDQYLPQQLTEEELREIVVNLVGQLGNKIGIIMKALKDEYEGRYDAKLVKPIIDSL